MATVLGIIAMISFFASLVNSFKAAGQVTPRMGAVGFLSIVFAGVGFVLGILSLGEPEKFVWFPRLGTIFCAVALLMWGWILMVGTGMTILY